MYKKITQLSSVGPPPRYGCKCCPTFINKTQTFITIVKLIETLFVAFETYSPYLHVPMEEGTTQTGMLFAFRSSPILQKGGEDV